MASPKSQVCTLFILSVMATLQISSGSTVVQQIRAEILSKGDSVSASQASASEASGASAALTESGYQQVVKLHSDAEMTQFISRLLSMHGLKVHTESMGELEGFVPWFSGVLASQNIKHLIAELTTAWWVTDSAAEAKDSVQSKSFSASTESKNQSQQRIAFAEEEVLHASQESSDTDDDLEESEAAEAESLDDQEMPSIGWSMGPKVGSSGEKHCFVKEESSSSDESAASSDEMTLEDAQIACDADDQCNFIWSHGCDMSWRKCYALAPTATTGDRSSCTLIKPTKGAALTESTMKDSTHAVQQLILQALLESDIDKVPAHIVEELRKKKPAESQEEDWDSSVAFADSGDESMEEVEDDADEAVDLDYSEDDAMMQKKSKAEILRAKRSSESRMVRLFQWLTR